MNKVSHSKQNNKPGNRKGLYYKILFIFSGIIATIWFLIRVIPKPSRAYYPCQRATFPIMTSFIIWILGISSGISTYKKVKSLLSQKRFLAAMLISLALIMITSTLFLAIPPTKSMAIWSEKYILPEPVKRYSYVSANSIKPEATVSIIQSGKENAFDITKDEVESMVFKAIELAGGLENLVTDGDTVVIKPNLVTDVFNRTSLNTVCNGLITDWRVVAAVAKKVRQLNPHGKIYIISGSVASNAFSKLNYNTANIPDADDFIAIENTSGAWHEYDSEKLCRITLPEGKALYPTELCPNNENIYYLNKIYYDANLLISIPVLKNHESAGVTGAVKNVGIGATPANIYGRTSGYSLRDFISHKQENLHKWIHDFYMARPVDFTIMDGLQGFNNGPVNSNASSNISVHQENMRIIAASKDPIAMDAIAALLMGDDPAKVGYLVYLNNDKLGCSNPLAIKVKGAQVSDLKKDFPHVSSDAKSDDYTDFTPPAASLKGIVKDGNLLKISLETDETVAKVDIEISDTCYTPIITSGFNQLVIEVPSTPITEAIPKITIHVQDKYLNATTLSNWVTSSGEVNNFGNTKVYPTLVDNYLHIEFEKEYLSTIRIYDMSGKLVQTVKPGYSDSYSIDCSSLSKGTYQGTIENESGILPFRFVKSGY